jgi:hypothetical protein
MLWSMRAWPGERNKKIHKFFMVKNHVRGQPPVGAGFGPQFAPTDVVCLPAK